MDSSLAAMVRLQTKQNPCVTNSIAYKLEFLIASLTTTNWPAKKQNLYVKQTTLKLTANSKI